MAKVWPPVEPLSAGKPATVRPTMATPGKPHSFTCSFRAAKPLEGKNAKIYKELGLFSLKRKIENAINHAEMIVPVAMELEEERLIKQEEVLRECNLWDDDITASDESLIALADTIKVVNNLKDVRHKAEEAKLITQLAELDVINHQLFRQAYTASLDVNKFLDHYEMSKFLSGPYDKQGACMIIKAGTEGITAKMWTEKLLYMYIRWAEKHGCKVTGLEKFPAQVGGTKLVTIELEKEYMYGYLSGEKGNHKMIHNSIIHESCSASIDVIPLFLENMVDFHIDDRDMEVSSPPSHEDFYCRRKTAVSIRHFPSNTVAQCSGERSQFANKMKALNRLKAMLLVMSMGDGLEASRMKNDADIKECKSDTRRYTLRPQKSVHDLKTGIILPELNSVLGGNIEPFISAHIRLRRARDVG